MSSINITLETIFTFDNGLPQMIDRELIPINCFKTPQSLVSYIESTQGGNGFADELKNVVKLSFCIIQDENWKSNYIHKIPQWFWDCNGKVFLKKGVVI